MKRKWELTPWTNDWNEQYKLESDVLNRIFQDEIAEIHHVGSISVPSHTTNISRRKKNECLLWWKKH